MTAYARVNRVLVGDGTNSASTITSLAQIKKGDLFLIKENGTIVANASAAKLIPKFEKVTIALGLADGEARLSSPIQGNTVSQYIGKSYVAPVESVKLIGPGIQATNGKEYKFRIIIKDDNRVHGQRPTIIDFNGTANGSQEDLALDIAKKFNYKEYNKSFQQDLIKLERVNDGICTAFAATITTIVTKGSVAVTTGAAHGLVAGDPIRIQGIDYTVATVPTTTTLTLDVPYVGVTETIAAGTTGTGTVATISNWGFKLTGLPQNSKVSNAANDPIDPYEWVNFDTSFSAVDATFVATVTNTNDANPGQGYWKQVSWAEHCNKPYLGNTSNRRYYDQVIESNVNPSLTYGSIVITHDDTIGGDLQDTRRVPLQTEVYIPSSTAQGTVNSSNPTTTSTNFIDILNAYFSEAVGFTALTTLA